jgi:hypothetical protein
VGSRVVMQEATRRTGSSLTAGLPVSSVQCPSCQPEDCQQQLRMGAVGTSGRSCTCDSQKLRIYADADVAPAVGADSAHCCISAVSCRA